MLRLPDPHSIATVVGTFAWTAFGFLHPDLMAHSEVFGECVFPAGYVLLAGGQAAGDMGLGFKRRLQGGSTAPDTIIPPAPPPKETTHPFVPQ